MAKTKRSQVPVTDEFPPYKSVAVSDLTPYANNARTHSEEQVAQIAASIKEFGFISPVVIDGNNGIIAGHGRVLACQNLGIKEVPCVEVSWLTETQKRAYILADNKLALNAGWDDALLKVELDELKLEGFDVSLTGFSDLEFRSISPAETVDAEPQLDRAEELLNVWKVERGQIWQIGGHRLMCGDSTSTDDVGRLMGGAKADMLHTDPPYGVSIVAIDVKVGADKPFGSTSGTKRKTSTGFDSRKRTTVQNGPKSKNQIIQSNTYLPIKGDDEPFDPTPFLGMAPIVVLWGGNYFADRLPVSSCWICWDKREDITRNSFADCELAWCSKKAPARVFHHLWNGLHKGSQHGERRTHPTEKPVALFREIGEMFAPKGTWVDLFAGTGAQIVAAEQSGATCFAMEYEPTYCAVILQRLKDIGLDPELVPHGR